MKSDGRPGATATQHGKKVIALICAALIGAYLFLIFTNQVTGKGSEAASPTATESALVDGMVTQTAADGSLISSKAPEVAPAVPDAFSPVAQAQENTPSASSTDVASDPSSQTVATGTAVKIDDANWQEAVKVAQSSVQSYCEWSSAESAKQYVDGIGGLTDAYRKSLTDATSKAWPQVQRMKSSAACTDAVDADVAPTSFDSKKNIAVMSLSKSQRVSSAGRPDVRRVVSFEVTVVKDAQGWKVDYIRS